MIGKPGLCAADRRTNSKPSISGIARSVKQHAGPLAFDALQGLVAAGGDRHLKSAADQALAQVQGLRRTVVHDQHAADGIRLGSSRITLPTFGQDELPAVGAQDHGVHHALDEQPAVGSVSSRAASRLPSRN